MKRKIIQIAVSHDTENDVTIVNALADDGTLWSGFNHWVGSGKPAVFQWDQLPALPDNDTNLHKVR